MAKRKLIITVALTGGVHRKNVNPALPEQPEEIAQAAIECYNEGAAILHLHARDSEGNPSCDPIIYSRIHRLIRDKCNIVLQDTSSGGGNSREEERIDCFYADPKPEMASLNMGSLVRTVGPYAGTFFNNPRPLIEDFAGKMLEFNIKPEMEVYSSAMFREVNNLIEKGLIKKPYYVNLVLGMNYQGAVEANPRILSQMIDNLPKDSIFNVSAIGRFQLHLTTMSMIVGGMVRVGMEDNIYYRKGELAQSNAQLVARTARIARELGIEIATPDDAREILGLA